MTHQEHLSNSGKLKKPGGKHRKTHKTSGNLERQMPGYSGSFGRCRGNTHGVFRQMPGYSGSFGRCQATRGLSADAMTLWRWRLLYRARLVVTRGRSGGGDAEGDFSVFECFMTFFVQAFLGFPKFVFVLWVSHVLIFVFVFLGPGSFFARARRTR